MILHDLQLELTQAALWLELLQQAVAAEMIELEQVQLLQVREFPPAAARADRVPFGPQQLQQVVVD